MKIFNATYTDGKGTEKVVPVAAQSLRHAANKAEKETEKHTQTGQLTKLELTDEIII